MRDIVKEAMLRREAIRLAKKDNDNYDNMSKEEKENLIEMLMEDLNDKYSEEY